MLQYIIPMIESYFSSGLFEFFFIPVISLAVLATIPCIIREIVRFR